MGSVDLRAVGMGTVSALILILPAGLLARVLLGDDPSEGWRYAYLGLVLVATLLGSFGTGRRAPATPMLHGSLTGLATFVIAQVVWSLVTGTSPNLVGGMFFALTFACLGTLGGFVATLGRPVGDRPNPEAQAR